MFSSLKKGIENTTNCDWILFHQIDQPNLPQDFYHNFVNQIDPIYDWIQPVYKNNNGHPVLIGKNVIERIRNANNSDNLREIKNSNTIKKKFWKCRYEAILTDIDNKSDYNNLVRNK